MNRAIIFLLEADNEIVNHFASLAAIASCLRQWIADNYSDGLSFTNLVNY